MGCVGWLGLRIDHKRGYERGQGGRSVGKESQMVALGVWKGFRGASVQSSHFTDAETEAQDRKGRGQGHTAREW